MGQTVNLLTYVYGGSNPSLPTKHRENATAGHDANVDLMRAVVLYVL